MQLVSVDSRMQACRTFLSEMFLTKCTRASNAEPMLPANRCSSTWPLNWPGLHRRQQWTRFSPESPDVAEAEWASTLP